MDIQIYAPIDKDVFEQTIVDTNKVVQLLNSANEYHTLFEVIDHQLNGFEYTADPKKNAKIYKVHNFKNDNKEQDHNQHKQVVDHNIFELQNTFFAIKVFKLLYLGKPAIAIHMSDISKKLSGKII